MKRSGEVWVHSRMLVLLTWELLLWAARDEAALGRKNRGELPGFLLLLDKSTLESVCPWYRMKTAVWVFWADQRIKRVVCMKSKLMWGKSNRAYFLRSRYIYLAAKILKFYNSFIHTEIHKYVFFWTHWFMPLICSPCYPQKHMVWNNEMGEFIFVFTSATVKGISAALRLLINGKENKDIHFYLN